MAIMTTKSGKMKTEFVFGLMAIVFIAAFTLLWIFDPLPNLPN